MFAYMLNKELLSCFGTGRKEKYKKNVRDLCNEDILSVLHAKDIRPLQKEFQVGDLITQEILFLDPSNGKPTTAYTFPLPGQPAKVVARIPNPLFHDDEVGVSCGVEDILIQGVSVVSDTDLTMREREISVASRFFRPWKEGETIDPIVADWIDKQAAEE